MPNAWLNHVRQFRKNNKNMSYKQLLKQAKNSYSGGGEGEEKTTMQQKQGGGEEAKPMSATSGLQSAMQSLRAMTTGGGVTGFESRSSLTRSASSVGGRRSSRSRQSNQSKQSRTRSSRKTRRSRR